MLDCWPQAKICARLGILEPSARERPWESAHLPPSQIRGEMGDSESVVGLVLAGSLGEAGQVRDSPLPRTTPWLAGAEAWRW